MDSQKIIELMVSNSIGWLITFIFSSIVGIFSYRYGINKKDYANTATTRKNEIYIPLKREMEQLIETTDIWKSISSLKANEIIKNDNEIVPDETLREKCVVLCDLITMYNQINLYTVAGDILCKHFEEKYTELYGSIYHSEVYSDEYNEFEYDELDREVEITRHNVYLPDVVDEIFKREEELINPSTLKDAISDAYMWSFSSKTTKKLSVDYIKEKDFVPYEYISDNFALFDIFYNDPRIERRYALLCSIKEIAFEITEELNSIIRNIVKKYEKE